MTKNTLNLLLTFVLISVLAACAPSPKLAGNYSMTLKDYEQAKVEYTKALKDDPDSVQLLTGLGRAHYNLGEYPEAIEAFTHATEIEEFPQASLYLGLSQIANGDREAGFTTLREFRYTGRPMVTDSVRDMATRLEPQTDATQEYIADKIFHAWDEGVKKELETSRPDK